MKIQTAIVGLLLIASFETYSALANPSPSPPLDQPAPDRPTSAKNPFVASLRPVLCSDVPELGKVAFAGDIVNLRRLIAAGVPIEAAGRDGRTPLILAAAAGNLETVSALLAVGANVNAQDHAGSTALHWAAQRGDDKVTLLLLSHRPKVDVQDRMGETPLIFAAIAGDEVIVRALLSFGANRDFRDTYELTAAQWAEKNKFEDIASLLDRRGN